MKGPLQATELAPPLGWAPLQSAPPPKTCTCATQKVLGEFDSAIKHYSQQAAGPTKWPRLVAFLQQQYGHASTEWMAREAAAAAAALAAEREAARDAVGRGRDAEARAARVRGGGVCRGPGCLAAEGRPRERRGCATMACRL
jgi:hypothetical protein